MVEAAPQEDQAIQTALKKADQIKQEANELFKNKNYTDASAKYFAAIDQLKKNKDAAKSTQGKDLEIACRNNLAQSKIFSKEFEQAIDQSERVLEIDPYNAKAHFRLSKAAFTLSNGTDANRLKQAMKHASQIAYHPGNMQNQDIQNHFKAVKAKHDPVVGTTTPDPADVLKKTTEAAKAGENKGSDSSKPPKEKSYALITVGLALLTTGLIAYHFGFFNQFFKK